MNISVSFGFFKEHIGEWGNFFQSNYYVSWVGQKYKDLETVSVLHSHPLSPRISGSVLKHSEFSRFSDSFLLMFSVSLSGCALKASFRFDWCCFSDLECPIHFDLCGNVYWFECRSRRDWTLLSLGVVEISLEAWLCFSLFTLLSSWMKCRRSKCSAYCCYYTKNIFTLVIFGTFLMLWSFWNLDTV